ncbi:MAG TPA: selenocysteine-specific translation elongation factor [Acidobacteriota bacterium]|nr:selenocysteine-specific translation elongation factor [Acidobacteriota bacterium]HNT18051.1 selenocysteine-specific translation elongation factor [Acidobacteriota bacterium]HPA27090.1 selenocysteine-specific translation elongation factor [Acidobacteriota bacterium]HQO18959.1 selenocysteine-specific translation elongation factor [Acidobacteriota bacterium]HQQ46381.1 selenocysteine-specific translation elongation factor [Acidobacteriota bacterium]
MKNVVVGTAGHIDHGKTLLVRSLTGIDADRLAEEKRRGITIDIGFAVLREADLIVHFVDLPGHEKFIKNMLAGATGMDFFLLVVAADESVMPQTVEHLEILKLLGIERGIVAVNKIDKADLDAAEVCRMEVRDLLKSRGFRDIEVIDVSAKSGEGTGLLKEAIIREAAASADRDASRPFRLPVDRVFSIRGFGTVITGTSTSGTLTTGDSLTFYPSLLKSKVRGIEVFREKRERASGGERVALNVPDVFPDEIARGETAAAADSMFPAKYFYCSLDIPRGILSNGSEFQMHAGTTETPVRIAYPGTPGKDDGRLIVQARPTRELALWAGDRFILRLPSPVRTAGGGTVLLPTSRRAKWHSGRTGRVAALLRSSEENAVILALLAESGEMGVSRNEAARKTGMTGAAAQELAGILVEQGKMKEPVPGEWWIGPSEFEKLCSRAVYYLRKKHEGPPVRTYLSKEEFFSHFGRLLPEKWTGALLEILVEKGEISIDRDRMKLNSFVPPLSPDDEKKIRKIMDALGASFPVPLGKDELFLIVQEKDRWLVNMMRGDGRLVAIDGGNFFLSEEGFQRVSAKLAEFARKGHRMFKVPEFKDFLGLTRKTAIPLLEHFDRLGMTKRNGDTREVLLKGDGDEAS